MNTLLPSVFIVFVVDGRKVGHLPLTISRVVVLFRLPPRLEALYQQCKTSAYKYLCGHISSSLSIDDQLGRPSSELTM